MLIKRVVIVGGGTAGWLAANHLGVELLSENLEITVIESEDVPIIGVGEGTVPHLKRSLQKFGISEAELLVSCDATFKQGIKFINWLDSNIHGEDHFYYHPFTTPFPGGFDVTSYWLQQQNNKNYFDLTEGIGVAEAMRSPKKISSAPYMGEVEYAYHFNAHKFANLMANNAIKKYGIKHKIGTIAEVVIDPDEGGIDKLILTTGEILEFDFYVDCSGFSGLLAERALGVPLKDKSSQILTDTAFVQQVATEPTDEIAPYTKATAHKAGWIWDIPLTNRRGTGFVYSSAHMSEDVALESFAKYLGVSEKQFSPRKIPMKIGYRETFWYKNCVSFGLAQGFVEPLEATSILITDFSAELFSRNFPKTKDDIPVLNKYCNKVVEYAWERIIDFVQFHYVISDRTDSQFWLDNINSTSVSEALQERLARWKISHPKKSDFFSHFELFGVESYLFVLYGMKYHTREADMLPSLKEQAKGLFQQVKQKSELLQSALPSHREWLEKLSVAMANAK